MISILGAGAIGQLLAHKLTEASIDCQLIIKPDSALGSDTWKLDNVGSVSQQTFKTISTNEVTQLEHLWVCVKSPQLSSALEAISHAISDNTQVVLFQNGMGHEQTASQFIKPEQLFFASNTHGAFKTSPQRTQYGGQGHISFGQLSSSQKPEWLSEELLKALNAHWEDDILTVLWKKLFVNAIVNPLTAIYQCTNGKLLDDDKKPKVLALINENQRLAQAMKLDFAEQLKDIVINVIQATSDNQNSMLLDVINGTTTEINAINGHLLDTAQRYSVPTPHNWRLWSEFHIAYPPLKAVAKSRANELDELSYQVTQEHGTEPPFSGNFNLHQEKGVYRCVCCDSTLFKDNSKFDSGCGWPSFDRAEDNKAIAYKVDNSHGMARTEILCAQCGSHLGHVFEDGPTATGQRFCVNSVSLNFQQDS